MRAALVIASDIRAATLMVRESVVSTSMDRSEAATTLLLWQMDGEPNLTAATDHAGDWTLLSLVNEESRRRPPPPPPAPARPILTDDFLRLDEEDHVRELRTRLGVLSDALRPEDYEDLRARLGPDVLPMKEIREIGDAIDRLAAGTPPGSSSGIPEARGATVRPARLRAILLFSHDGRLLAEEGETKGFDVRALSALVARAEPGSTWSLAHRAGFLVGHGGSRTALVALFEDRPAKNVPLALKASVLSLEQRRGLLDPAHAIASQPALTEYVRAVRLLLLIETS